MRPKRRYFGIPLLFMIGLCFAACGARSQSSSPLAPSSYNHIYLIVMENASYAGVVGNPQMPYINSLMAQYGLATEYTGVAHPSQPNYLALLSGSTQSVTDDDVHKVNAQNLLDQLEAHGRTWKVFAENYPLNCFTGSSSSGGADGDGQYVQRHNPAISFMDINTSPQRCANITDLAHFDPAAANFEFIAPNQCHNMHDCAPEIGDQFLTGFVPRILNSDAWKENGMLLITWDEGEDDAGGGGRVPLLVISNHGLKGFQSPIPHNHYSLLRTIEENWELGCLAQTCSVTALDEFRLAQK